VELLEPEMNNLPEFLSKNKRGTQVVEYLKTLANFLAQEQTSMLNELAGLTKNIEHIKQIVAMQQSYAKASGVEEIHSPSVLVEDALRIHMGALERHHVTVVRDYEKVPDIVADKHKVLQILINLIGNAKYALADVQNDKRQTTLSVKANGRNTIHISVKDNGVGIAPENLVRIFSHGFTTRKNGHGFGLHSGFLAAKEMGGSLSVQSEGPGRGAVFTLELPLNARSKS
jgi:C4-dicarboxylate-specific signal transduction histidine kinase